MIQKMCFSSPDQGSLTLREVRARFDSLDSDLNKLCDRMASLLKTIQRLESDHTTEDSAQVRQLKKSYNTCYEKAARMSEQMRDLQAVYEILKCRSEGRLRRTAAVA